MATVGRARRRVSPTRRRQSGRQQIGRTGRARWVADQAAGLRNDDGHRRIDGDELRGRPIRFLGVRRVGSQLIRRGDTESVPRVVGADRARHSRGCCGAGGSAGPYGQLIDRARRRRDHLERLRVANACGGQNELAAGCPAGAGGAVTRADIGEGGLPRIPDRRRYRSGHDQPGPVDGSGGGGAPPSTVAAPAPGSTTNLLPPCLSSRPTRRRPAAPERGRRRGRSSTVNLPGGPASAVAVTICSCSGSTLCMAPVTGDTGDRAICVQPAGLGRQSSVCRRRCRGTAIRQHDCLVTDDVSGFAGQPKPAPLRHRRKAPVRAECGELAVGEIAEVRDPGRGAQPDPPSARGAHARGQLDVDQVDGGVGTDPHGEPVDGRVLPMLGVPPLPLDGQPGRLGRGGPNRVDEPRVAGLDELGPDSGRYWRPRTDRHLDSDGPPWADPTEQVDSATW